MCVVSLKCSSYFKVQSYVQYCMCEEQVQKCIKCCSNDLNSYYVA